MCPGTSGAGQDPEWSSMPCLGQVTLEGHRALLGTASGQGRALSSSFGTGHQGMLLVPVQRAATWYPGAEQAALGMPTPGPPWLLPASHLFSLMMRFETKSLASSETLSKVSSSKYQLAARTLLSVSVSLSPKKGERPLSLGAQWGEEPGALRLWHLPNPPERSQSGQGCPRERGRVAPRWEVVCGYWHHVVLLPAAGLSLSLPADAGTDPPQPSSVSHSPTCPSPHPAPFTSPPNSRVPGAHVQLGDNSMPRSALSWHGAGSPPPRPSPDVQHVGDDAHAPHVRGVGDLLVVDHLGGEEFGGAKVHLQLLLGVVPAARAGESAGGGQAAPPHPCPPPGRHCSPQPSRASQGEPGLAAVARAGAHSGSRVSQHLKGSWGRRVGGRQGEGMEPRRGEDGTFEPAQSR